MRVTVLLLTLACAVSWAASDAALAPRAIASRKSTIADGVDAITIPQQLSYQGKLTDTMGIPVNDTTYQVTFRLYTVPSGGSSFWDETQTVRTRGGLFSTLLGSVAQIESVPSSGNLYLGMAVAGGAEMSPRLRLVGSAYSYLAGKSANADLLEGKDTSALDSRYVNEGQASSVTSNMIVDGTIAAADLGQMGAASGQVMKWTGSAWAPRNDSVGGGGTVTSVSQATGAICTPNPITTTGTVGFDQSYGDGRYVNEAQAGSISTSMIVDTNVTMAKLAQAGATTGQVVKWTGGAWAPGPDNTGGGSGVTNVYQDTGTICVPNPITSTGNVKLNLTYADARYVNENQAAAGDLTGTYPSPTIAQKGAASGQVLKWSGSAWTPRNDSIGGTGTVTSVSQGTGVVCSPNPITTTGSVRMDTTYSDGRFVNEGQSNSVTSAMLVDGTVAAADLNQMGASSGQVMKWTGSAWAPRNDSIGSDNDWVRVGGDSVLYTIHQLGLARGGAGNALQTNTQTQVNFGVQCSTGALAATVGGGQGNRAGGQYATVAGGLNNKATSDKATVGGGGPNTASNTGATVAGGASNSALGTLSTVGGGTGNAARDTGATVGGGVNDTAYTAYSTVGGGLYNVADYGHGATVAGGDSNHSDDLCATVSGGAQNCALWPFGTVGGGRGDTAQSVCSGVLSGLHNVAGNASTDSFAVVAGGSGNRASAGWSTVGGGWHNTASGSASTVGGGSTNTADSVFATVGGGLRDTASGRYATVGGGINNTASGHEATVAGGQGNTASDWDATVGGGCNNTASGGYATVGGGYENAASGHSATVCGGYGDTVYADYSFAVGHTSVVPASYTNSAAFNGTRASASNQLCCGVLSKTGGSFTIDDPIDPQNKILNHYFVESPDMSNLYSGSVVLDADGRAEVRLPDYFDALNRNPRAQLTGVGSSDVYVAEDISGNRFVIGGKPGIKVYWQVTGDRKDQSAEVIRTMMPVEQPKTGSLAGVSWDDNFLAGCMQQLEQMGKAGEFSFRTAAGRQRYENMLKHLREAEQPGNTSPVRPRGESKQPVPPSLPLKPKK